MTLLNKKSNSFHRYFLSLSIGLFLILVIASLLIPKGDDVLLINNNFTPFQDWFFRLITLLGDGLIFLPIIIILLFVRFQYALTFAVVGIANGIVISFLKRVVFTDLKRPIAFLDNSLLHFVEGVSVHSSHSFPSGHTATAFAMAATFALCFKNKSWTTMLFCMALLVGYSRIYLLQHYLVDVTAGAIIGTVCTVLVMRIGLLKTPSWTQQRIQIRIPSRKKGSIQPSGR
jgi:membrane-associated phospholipid phosphatase